MRRILKSIATAVVAATAIAASTAAHAEDIMDRILQRGELRVGVQTQGEPVSFIDKNGDRTGLAIDLVTMMAKDLNVKLVIQDYDWKGLIPALLADKFDIIAADMTPTPERTAALLFSKPFFYQDTIAFTAKDKPFTKWEDLNTAGVSVGGTQGGTYIVAIKEFMPNATAKEFASGPASAQAVASGRVDAGVSSVSNVAAYSTSFDNLKVLDGVITREPLAFATRKENIQLKFWMDNYIDLITADRKLDRLLDYWWNTTAWEKDHK
ncbi:transporter substrate-binding domain-containing protein [Pseudaminobacter soli (ex Li et al. 2025)]|uniref:Amino acid ABC transporter substrate-binding protein n=1 Tax=Pseudaminobacter soli (ex Li et al. 2025) TaxID=1295366 RepID=A0A2P7SKU6_9HYPH|nr:transporter substrate-binding domain-containing protein [Mesorhizobium soli]PSJ63113.1 amino acid ABC transporter substrate-binding protein [Mesorhizobium soli]